jgi:predicted RNA polymerase sigma factor
LIERELRVHWWPAVAAVTRVVGDLRVAEEAVQEACLIAVTRWPRDGTPANPRAWLIGTARHKAVDMLRRDAARTGKEAAAMHAAGLEGPADESPDDQLSLIFLCCHPAFDLPAQIARYDLAMIAEGEYLLETELRRGAAGPYLIQAAIAACHSTAPTAADTDWREIAALYGELLRCEPSAVHEANRGIAVAMSEGPAAGLVILDVLSSHRQLARWPGLHLARADLLARIGPVDDALDALSTALELDPSPPERRFIHQRLAELGSP